MVWFHDIGIHVKLALFFFNFHGTGTLPVRHYVSVHDIFGVYVFGMSDQHFEWFSILISRNWYSRQPRSFTFGITLSTQNTVAHKVWKIPPIRGGWIIFIFRGAVFWLLAFRLVQSFDFTELACTSSSRFYFRHYVEHRTGLRIKSEKIPLIWGGWIIFIFRGTVFLAAGISIGSVFWFFHRIGVHVKPALLLSALRWAQNRVAHQVWKIPPIWIIFIFSISCFFAAGIWTGSVFLFHGIGVHVKLALLLSALRWAQNRVAHQVWTKSLYRGRLN